MPVGMVPVGAQQPTGQPSLLVTYPEGNQSVQERWQRQGKPFRSTREPHKSGPEPQETSAGGFAAIQRKTIPSIETAISAIPVPCLPPYLLRTTPSSAEPPPANTRYGRLSIRAIDHGASITR